MEGYCIFRNPCWNWGTVLRTIPGGIGPQKKGYHHCFLTHDKGYDLGLSSRLFLFPRQPSCAYRGWKGSQTASWPRFRHRLFWRKSRSSSRDLRPCGYLQSHQRAQNARESSYRCMSSRFLRHIKSVPWGHLASAADPVATIYFRFLSNKTQQLCHFVPEISMIKLCIRQNQQNKWDVIWVETWQL